MLAAESVDGDPKKWRPQPEDFTLLHELVAQVRDRLGDVASLIADLPTPVKQRREPLPRFPRPETEVDKARRRITEERERAHDERLFSLMEEGKRRWREEQEQGLPAGQ